MKFLIPFFAILAVSLFGVAHEGHNMVPGKEVAPHVGQMKGTSQMYIELVSNHEGIRVYLYDHNLKPVSLSEVKIEGTLKFPKKSKTEKINFALNKDFFEAKIDSEKSHRYIVDLKVTSNGKTEKVQFSVEMTE